MITLERWILQKKKYNPELIAFFVKRQDLKKEGKKGNKSDKESEFKRGKGPLKRSQIDFIGENYLTRGERWGGKRNALVEEEIGF